MFISFDTTATLPLVSACRFSCSVLLAALFPGGCSCGRGPLAFCIVLGLLCSIVVYWTWWVVCCCDLVSLLSLLLSMM